MTQPISIGCKINHEEKTLHAYPMSRLLDVLRDTGLTGTKEGCGEGECGACSILLNGKLVNSCLVPVLQAEGAEILTIEGVCGENQSKLHPIQTAFMECGGAQCGICTPGMILASLSLLQKNSHPSDEQIRQALAGNICRCTGYMKIIDSVREAATRKATP